MSYKMSEQELLRHEKCEQIRKSGIDPFPSSSFDHISIVEARQRYEVEKKLKGVSLAGRVMNRRIMGSASFVTIQDECGAIQLYVHRDTLCPSEEKELYNQLFKKWIDIGDIIGVSGELFTTKMGEVTLRVNQLKLLSKALRPLPVVKEKENKGERQVYSSFSNPEIRYRQRYVDLIVNPDVRTRFRLRTKMIQVIRDRFNQSGYLEVETPILQPLYGGASARPFVTHHHTLDMQLYLRISNELYLKRLIVGGYEGVYEFSKDFRNEGMSRFHNPEFTMLEAYVAYKDYYWMIDQVELLLSQIAQELHGRSQVQVGSKEIDFTPPYPRYTMFEVIEKYTGVDISQMDEADLRALARKWNIDLPDGAGYGKIVDEIFGEKCEPLLINPTFITDYPVEMSPLAKRHRDDDRLVERFELICNGKELCNAFSELNDPVDQRERFESQVALGKRGDEEAMVLDEDFLRALSYGMPPTVGIGIGIDRLAMMMTGVESIQEVLFFPQMRHEQKE